jgi:broad specificity phosphatase PhoE
MTICLLVRHAQTAAGDSRLAGRSDCALSSTGEDQARHLAQMLPDDAVIQSSPRRRCLQTIAPYAEKCGRPVEVQPALDEVDFAGWTGQTFEQLDGDPAWRRWNEKRSVARVPSGESMIEVQTRMLDHIRNAATRVPDAMMVMMSHAEPIRAVVLSCLSLPLDEWHRVDIPHASITTVAVSRSGQVILDQRAVA